MTRLVGPALLCLLLMTDTSLSGNNSTASRERGSEREEQASLDLIKGLFSGELENVKQALAAGANADATIFVNYEGHRSNLSALSIATLLGDASSASLLLAAGARVGLSCTMGHLIAAMEPLNSVSDLSPQRRASFQNIMRAQSGVQCYLLPGDYRINRDDPKNRLIAAIDARDQTLVERLLTEGADKNAREEVLPADPVRGMKWPGRTCLMIAMLEHQRNIIRLLISKGVDVNAKASVGSIWGGWDGFTALMLAIVLDQEDTLQLLLLDANLEEADEEGNQAIHHAAERNSVWSLQSILSKAGSHAASLLTARNKNRDTPLVLATRARSVSAAKLLIEYGISNFGQQYLEFWGGAALLETVIHREFRTLSSADRDNARAAAKAIMIALLDGGADPNAVNQEGANVLMSAIEGGSDIDVIQALLNHNADPLMKDDKGRDSFSAAAVRPDAAEVIALLKMHN